MSSVLTPVKKSKRTVTPMFLNYGAYFVIIATIYQAAKEVGKTIRGRKGWIARKPMEVFQFKPSQIRQRTRYKTIRFH